MVITDWNTWMKDHHIYIPTPEEIEDANKRNSVKIRKLRKGMKSIQNALDEYRKKAESQR